MERVVQFLKEARQSMLDVIDYRTMDYYQRRYMAGKEQQTNQSEIKL